MPAWPGEPLVPGHGKRGADKPEEDGLMGSFRPLLCCVDSQHPNTYTHHVFWEPFPCIALSEAPWN